MTRGAGHRIDQYQSASLPLHGPVLFHSVFSVNYKLLRGVAVLLGNVKQLVFFCQHS